MEIAVHLPLPLIRVHSRPPAGIAPEPLLVGVAVEHHTA